MWTSPGHGFKNTDRTFCTTRISPLKQSVDAQGNIKSSLAEPNENTVSISRRQMSELLKRKWYPAQTRRNQSVTVTTVSSTS